MNMWLSFLCSLLLTSLASFTAPVILCVLTLVGLTLITYVPLMGAWGEKGYELVWNFLTVFGDGSGSMGILTIGLTCGIVGVLFEALNFYRYQTLIQQPITSWLLQQKSSNVFADRNMKGKSKSFFS